MSPEYVRDLLPVTAVRCQHDWRLVDYWGHCKGEKTRSKKPCRSLVGHLECDHFQADFDPKYRGGRLTGNVKIRHLPPETFKIERPETHRLEVEAIR